MRPLDGIRVIEMKGLGPSPYCGMLLADYGADVIVVSGVSKTGFSVIDTMPRNPLNRGKRLFGVDLKTQKGADIFKKMIVQSDVFIEPYRPGVMESLSFGPEEALNINPKLIYARMTGYGQEGPYAKVAGHDINYIALSGALSLCRRKGEKPLHPVNLLGDFAGGGLFSAFGILIALTERNRSGKGQVLDAAMSDGAANLTTFFHGFVANGLMSLDIGTNLLDSGAPFYQTYETADGKFVAVGALEPHFYKHLIEGLNLDPVSLPAQNDMKSWPVLEEQFSRVFKSKTRDEWEEIFQNRDACVSPVLSLDEVHEHPQNRERGTFITVDGMVQPGPALKLSRTPGSVNCESLDKKMHTREILLEMGYTGEAVDSLFEESMVE